MGNIKFRAWEIAWGDKDFPAGKMVEWSLLSGWTMAHFSRTSQYQFMQYTGLTDKNGEEIYEGDIVRATADDNYSENSICSDIIFGNDLQWQIRCGAEYHHGLPMVWGGWRSLEVIGNIYENPELLTK